MSAILLPRETRTRKITASDLVKRVDRGGNVVETWTVSEWLQMIDDGALEIDGGYDLDKIRAEIENTDE